MPRLPPAARRRPGLLNGPQGALAGDAFAAEGAVPGAGSARWRLHQLAAERWAAAVDLGIRPSLATAAPTLSAESRTCRRLLCWQETAGARVRVSASGRHLLGLLPLAWSPRAPRQLPPPDQLRRHHVMNGSMAGPPLRSRFGHPSPRRRVFSFAPARAGACQTPADLVMYHRPDMDVLPITHSLSGARDTMLVLARTGHTPALFPSPNRTTYRRGIAALPLAVTAL